jgi:hypothetical protein
MVRKASRAFAVPCQLNCTQTGWLLAGLMLALRWPSGPSPLDAGLRTQVPSDAGLPSALVTLVLVACGSGWCEKPVQSTGYNSTADRTNGPDDRQGFLDEFRSSRLSIFLGIMDNLHVLTASLRRLQKSAWQGALGMKVTS